MHAQQILRLSWGAPGAWEETNSEKSANIIFQGCGFDGGFLNHPWNGDKTQQDFLDYQRWWLETNKQEHCLFIYIYI